MSPAAPTSASADSARFVPDLGSVLRLAFVAFELALLVLVVRAFEIENRALLEVLVLASGAFLVNAVLPRHWRMTFFALVSIASIVVVFEPVNAAWLVGLGGALILLAHAPFPYAGRVTVIAAAGTIYGLARSGVVDVAVPGAVWPILGAMFMFRLISFLYDRKHGAAPTGFGRTAGYFFMVPNVCFPLFPVVDYKRFCASHYDAEPFGIYQRGLASMLRGIVHLLLYRYVYQNLLVDPAHVVDAGDAAQHVLTLYLLYLKISGSFHLIVGMLHLFGFNLTETHHLYFLASSFTDYWRRINIYWKDFIQKIVFNPTFFAAKKRTSALGAMAVATAVAFFFTWLLHSYQWFWIRGTLDWRWQDAFFWTVLGVLVFVNVLIEARTPPRRSLKAPARTWRTELARALSTIGTFVVLAICWLVWSTESTAELRVVFAAFLDVTPQSAFAIVGVLAGLGVAAIAFGGKKGTHAETAARVAVSAADESRRFWRTGAVVATCAVVLLAIGTRPALLAFSPPLAEAVAHLRHARRLNQQDAQMLERGYYEDLTSVGRFNDELAEVFQERPEDWTKNDAIVRTGSFPPYELVPSKQVAFKGKTFTTNAHAFRDRDYALEKEPGTFRIVLLGSSHALGEGVGDLETFENLVEDELNREHTTETIRRYEILDFAVRGYGPLCCLATLERRAAAFRPDVVVYAAINDYAWIVREVGQAASAGIAVPFEHVAQAARAAGVEPEMPRVLAESKLEPIAPELVAWTYARYVESSRAAGAKACITFLPRPEDRSSEDAAIAEQLEIARRAGFTPLDTSSAYAGVDDWSKLWVSSYDRHPNADGHRRLARAFRDALLGVIRDGPAGGR